MGRDPGVAPTQRVHDEWDVTECDYALLKELCDSHDEEIVDHAWQSLATIRTALPGHTHYGHSIHAFSVHFSRHVTLHIHHAPMAAWPAAGPINPADKRFAVQYFGRNQAPRGCDFVCDLATAIAIARRRIDERHDLH